MNAHKKILIVMDESKEVLNQGLRLARDEKARVTVLKVISLAQSIGPAASGEFSSLSWSGGVQVKKRVLTGDLTSRVVEVADEEKCDLIVMGPGKKRGVLTRIFGDHAVEKVIDRAACPVFIVNGSCELREKTHPEGCGYKLESQMECR